MRKSPSRRATIAPCITDVHDLRVTTTNTPRTFHPCPELWDAVKETTARRGETPDDVIVRALERYVHRHLPPKG